MAVKYQSAIRKRLFGGTTSDTPQLYNANRGSGPTKYDMIRAQISPTDMRKMGSTANAAMAAKRYATGK